MKISKLFHWLYFSVMMLPIFILPIFALAVRSDNNFQPIEVQVEENKVVNFNQLNDEYLYSSLSNVTFEDDVYNVTSGRGYALFSSFYVQANHIYLFRTDFQSDVSSSNNGYIQFFGSRTLYVPNGTKQTLSLLISRDTDSNSYFEIGLLNSNNNSFEFSVPLYFDLTLMFGAGNEPSVDEFNTWFSDNFYPFNTGSLTLIPDYFVTYNDTDFASQMVYTMYQGVDKYFNYDSVFNFGDLYNWCVTTFFNGQISLGFFIMWHLLIYWLLTSLLWLLFDVLIYVPMLIHRWLDKASLS